MSVGARWRPRAAYLFAGSESGARRWALAPLALLEIPYREAARAHRALYARGWLARARLPAIVISIGNLTVGGSAKTPTAAWLAARLSRAGWRVALLSRGYRAPSQQRWAVVSDGERIRAGAEQLGDEALWLARATPGVPVLAGADRAAAGRHAIDAFASQLLLVDDGFQHHRLARDLDLVCVDAAMGLGSARVLPRGPLREPLSALRAADAVIRTRADPARDPEPIRVPGSVPQFALPLAPVRLRPLDPGGGPRPLGSLRGARVGLLGGLARPETLRESLRAMGAEIGAERLFADHHPYAAADLVGLAPELEWVTTAKDAVKIQPDWVKAAGVGIWVLEEAVPEGEGEAVLGWLTREIQAKLGASRV